MRPRKGCQRCRERHVKCTVEPPHQACNRCIKIGDSCDFLPQYRFRNDVARSDVQEEEEDENSNSVEWSEDQTWVPLNKSFKYVFEDGKGVRAGDSLPDDGQKDSAMSEPVVEAESLTPDIGSFSNLSANTPGTSVDHNALTSLPGIGQSDLAALADASSLRSPVNTMTPLPREPPTLPSIGDLGRSILSPISQSSPSELISRIPPDRSYSRTSHLSNATIENIGGQALTPREAELLHCFIYKFAPMADVCDTFCHFAREVPRRALLKPMVLLSIFAVGARFLDITTDQPDLESQRYHDECVPLVIDALSSPEANYDEDLLVTVLLLRIHEEFSSVYDSMNHLIGANQMLNAFSRFASNGGLGEAASWQALRQVIYASVVQRHPLQVCLENYDVSYAAASSDDGSYANCAILLCAKVLRLAHSPADPWLASELDALEAKIDDWLARRPAGFLPVAHVAADPDGGRRPFPGVYMLGPAATVGSQYYHLAKILLLLAPEKARSPSVGFAGTRQRMVREKRLLKHLLLIVGLAESNDEVHNAKYTACHILSSCGYLITHPVQREAAISLLERAPRIIAWRTKPTIDMLLQQWAELDG